MRIHQRKEPFVVVWSNNCICRLVLTTSISRRYKSDHMVGHSAQHRSKSSLVSHLLILLIFITIIIEMCLYNKIFKNQRSDDIRDNFNNGGHRVPSNVQNHGTHIRDEAFISGVYYSNWSPYKPRFHFLTT